MINQIFPSFRYDYNKTNTAIYKAGIGEGLPKHEHTFANTTLCIQGKIVVRKENKELILNMYDKPLLLTENEWHKGQIVPHSYSGIQQLQVF